MEMEKVINKGYTMKIVSWENDGDNYRTKFYSSDSKEVIDALCRICDLASRKITHTSQGIGNEMDDGKVSRIAEEFFELPENKILLDPEFEYTEEDYYEHLTEYCYELFGGSEFYICRVCEEYTVTYSEEDIYVQLVEQKKYR